MASGILHPIFGCPCVHFLSQLTLNFWERKYNGWQNSRWVDIARRTTAREGMMVSRTVGGVRSLERQMVNFGAPEIMIYLRLYLRAPFQCCGIKKLTHAFRTGPL